MHFCCHQACGRHGKQLPSPRRRQVLPLHLCLDLQIPVDHLCFVYPLHQSSEVKRTLGSITTNKASGRNGIPVELFQILKDAAAKVLHSVCQQIWKTQQWSQDWKWSVFIPIARKGNAEECSNFRTIALISHASKIMLKILQARLQQQANHEFPDVQSGFRKGRGTRYQIANMDYYLTIKRNAFE